MNYLHEILHRPLIYEGHTLMAYTCPDDAHNTCIVIGASEFDPKDDDPDTGAYAHISPNTLSNRVHDGSVEVLTEDTPLDSVHNEEGIIHGDDDG